MKRSLHIVSLVGVLLTASLFTLACSNGTVEKFVISNGAEPTSLDPSLITGLPEQNLNLALFEGLLRYDPKTARGVPGLAESWTISPDGLVYTFKLRDAVWSDGVPIDAQTVVDSWLRTLAPETASNYAYLLGFVIKGADAYNTGKGKAEDVALKALDAHTLQMTLTGPAPYALDMLPHQAFCVLPMHAIKKFGKDWTKVENFVGNGPYILKSWKPQEEITVVQNPKFWDAKNVFIKTIQFLPIEDQQTSYQKYKNGEIDYITQNAFPTAQIDEVKLRADYQVVPSLSIYYYAFNVTKPPMDKVEVRKALTMALNMQELTEKVLRGGEVAATNMVPTMPGYTPAKGNPFNVEEAKKLLAAAGYPDGKGFPKVTLIYNTSDKHKTIAEWAQQQWKTNLGIDIALENMEWKTFLQRRQTSHDFVITRSGWAGDYQDPNTFLDMFVTGSGNNDGLYSNKQFDDLIKLASTQTGEERMKTFTAAEEILITQDQAAIPFNYYVNQNIIDLTKWDGWYSNTLDFHSYIGMKKK